MPRPRLALTSLVPPFDRGLLGGGRQLSRLGAGALGGKARGLVLASQVLHSRRLELEPLQLEIVIPAMTIVATGAFEQFLERNRLKGALEHERPDDRIAHDFQGASLPVELLGDLRTLADEARTPLAVRSSSALEDALGQPFAGVYGTKMVPGNQPAADARFRALCDAVKFVYATTFFRHARAYRRAARLEAMPEAMAVIIQEVVGARHAGRFYPEVSGVARSYNFYPVGPALPDEGVVHLALGLGKTIVDGGRCWSFSPAHPRAGPPFASAAQLAKQTQTELWAVGVGAPPAHDPMAEAEYLVKADLRQAEADGTLRQVASTYDALADRLTPGTGRAGARVLDFAPLLSEVPLAPALRTLLALCEEALAAPVEIEFALTFPEAARPRLGFLQVRPLLLPKGRAYVSAAELADGDVLVASVSALGNGCHAVRDVVYVPPETFAARSTREIAGEIEQLNGPLVESGRPYLLIGFGRLGSSDPWLGIPVRWDQIAGASGIVEATLPGMNPEPSQGSHFFHNLSSAEALFFSVPHERGQAIDWDWLGRQQLVARTPHVCHVRCSGELLMKVDGRTRRGVIRRPVER